MNPHHQPQNNPYNPQNYAYPQQAGPSKYPTLPPIQNPQYPPQVNPYNPQARPGGYLPPAQYGNVQAQANHERERQAIVEKITEVENGFDSCFIKFYQVWLWFLGIASVVGAVGAFMTCLRAQGDIGGFVAVTSILLSWTFIQSVYGLKAISQRSIKKANLTCWLVTIGLIPSLILDIWLIVVLAEYPYPRPPPQHDWSPVIEFLIGVFSTQILIHVAISMNGAFKVRKILLEREVLQEKLNEIDYSFRA